MKEINMRLGMKIPEMEELQEILNNMLEEHFPDWNVELGENWELMAEIFYRVGYDKACSDHSMKD